ncbi:MAG: hypothetical protein JWM74_6275 [Myxococcaceae bacterium]|nr:hypothetical protein [Myxococcaceae bacterium]
MRTAIRFVLASSLLLVATPAFADDDEATAPATPSTKAQGATPAALPPLPTTPAATAPVAISAPANGPGLTVIAPLAGGGTMTATGCRNVTVAGGSADVRAQGACPPVPATAPIVEPLAEDRDAKEPPRDPGRKAMIITAPIVYGLAASVAGISYIEQSEHCHSNSASTPCVNARNWLIAYTGISAIVPSTPRMVVGDWTGALLYSAARGGSIITAAAVNWGKGDNWQGPFALGFAIPVALACVDLATTPHRAKSAEAPRDSARITSVAPVAVTGANGKADGAAVSMGGSF